jgi:hypothetical protein
MFDEKASVIAESMGFVTHYGMSPWMNLLEDKSLRGT